MKIKQEDLDRIYTLLNRACVDFNKVGVRIGVENLKEKIEGNMPFLGNEEGFLRAYMIDIAVSSEDYFKPFYSYIYEKEIGDKGSTDYLNEVLEKLGISKARLSQICEINSSTFHRKCSDKYITEHLMDKDKVKICLALNFYIEKLNYLKIALSHNPLLEGMKEEKKTTLDD